MAIRSHGGDRGGGNLPPSAGDRSERDFASRIADPLFAWAVRTRFRYLGGEPAFVPLLVQTSGATAAEVAAALSSDNGHDEPVWRIPALFMEPPKGLEKSRHFCILLDWTDKSRIASLGVLDTLERKFGARYEFGLPIGSASAGSPRVPASRPLNWQAPPAPIGTDGPPSTAALKPKSRPAVVIGVIDDGLGLAHERFRHAAGGSTRIESTWVQSLTQVGIEILASDIDAAVAASTHAGLVDESEVYRILGLADFGIATHKTMGRRVAHGTHVMDIAAGCDPGTAPANVPIVGVQLPEEVVRDTSGALLTPWAVWGMFYILTRALGLAPKVGGVPVVVNLSYGLFHGPHDGMSVFETAVDEIVRLWNAAWPNARMCVVLPGGNNFLWRCHAKFNLARSAHHRVAWRVVPDDRTSSFVEFWLPHPSPGGSVPSADVQVTAPDGTTSGWISLGASPIVVPPAASGMPPIWQVTYDSAATTGSRPRITLVVAPTAVFDPHAPGEPLAPSGVWRIDFRNTGPAITVDGWVGRDDTPIGWPVLGRQSYFDDPAYTRFDHVGRHIEVDNPPGYPASYVHRFGTINGLATGSRTVVVSGVRRDDLRMARYSAAGPTVIRPIVPPPSPRVGFDPDAAAVCQDSPARHGILAAGSRSNSTVAMGGTSVAAPQLTRWLAAQLAAGLPSCRQGTQALAFAEEAKHPGPVQSPDRFGAGRILILEPPLPPPNPKR